MASEKYVCSLDEKTFQKAKAELNEEPGKREKALVEFRDWIQRQHAWLKSPTDAVFLLSFLRKSDFSQIVAQKNLVNYWITRGRYPQHYKDVDLTNPKLLKILSSGQCFVLPSPDKHGRRVMMFRDDKFKEFMDDDDITAADILKVRMAIHDYLLMDEAFQVNGLVWLDDYTDASWDTFAYLQDDVTAAIGGIINASPMRVKVSHFSRPCDKIWQSLMQIFSHADDKTRKAVHIHSSWDAIYEDLGHVVLPVEYLPADYRGENGVKEQDIIDKCVQAMTRPNVVTWLKKLSSGEYGVDESKRPGTIGGLAKMASEILVLQQFTDE